jgi:hypothetical protein
VETNSNFFFKKKTKGARNGDLERLTGELKALNGELRKSNARFKELQNNNVSFFVCCFFKDCVFKIFARKK